MKVSEILDIPPTDNGSAIRNRELKSFALYLRMAHDLQLPKKSSQMKVFLIGLVICLLNSAFHVSPSAVVTIEVTNLRSNKGFVLVSLYNNAKAFPDDASKAVGKTKAVITGGRAVAVFDNVPAGKYAAAILHDENANLKMDFTGIGIPKEGYGFSNDAKGFLGPPSFSRAAFMVEGEKKILIRVVYFMK